MGLLGKVITLAGVAAGGVAAAASLLGNKGEKLADLEREFAEITREYEKDKAKLKVKIREGNKRAVDRLRELEDEYAVEEAAYEAKKKKLTPKKTKAEQERELTELKHQMEMEKLETMHAIQTQKNAELLSASTDIAICTSCGSKNNEASKFCSACGHELSSKRFCTKCGANLDFGVKFCSMCGQMVN